MIRAAAEVVCAAAEVACGRGYSEKAATQIN